MATSKLHDFRGKNVQVIVADNYTNADHLLGKFLDDSHYDTVIEQDTDCYIKPNCDISTTAACSDDSNCAECAAGVNEENVAFIFRKNWFTEEQQKGAYLGLRNAATTSDNRGTAAGLELVEDPEGHAQSRATKLEIELLDFMMNPKARIDGGDPFEDIINRNKKEVLLKLRWIGSEMDEGFVFEDWFNKTKTLPQNEMIKEASRVRLWIGDTSYANKVNSGVAGSYDRYPRIPYLRMTAYNDKHQDEFDKSLPFLKRLNDGFKQLLPKRWTNQEAAAKKIDQRYLIKDTVFTTLTVNSRFRTAAHYDAADLPEGFSNLTVVSNDGNYTGGYLVFPAYRVAVNVRPGDLLLVANHTIVHGNTEFVFNTPESDRVSIVAYFREGMLKGGVKEYEDYRHEFVVQNSKDQSQPEWRPRFNGVYAGMFCDKESDDPMLAKRWFDFLMRKPDGEKFLKTYHPWLHEFYTSSRLEDFFA